jgi:hypothetical protein
VAFAVGEANAVEKTIYALRVARASQSRAHLIDAAELLFVALVHEGRLGDAARVSAVGQRSRDAYSYRWRWPHIENLTTNGIEAFSRRPAESLVSDTTDIELATLDVFATTALARDEHERPQRQIWSPRAEVRFERMGLQMGVAEDSARLG